MNTRQTAACLRVPGTPPIIKPAVRVVMVALKAVAAAGSVALLLLLVALVFSAASDWQVGYPGDAVALGLLAGGEAASVCASAWWVAIRREKRAWPWALLVAHVWVLTILDFMWIEAALAFG
jgi:hypothetical protein